MFPKSLGHGMVVMGFDARPPGPGCPLSPLSTLLRTLAKMTPTTCFRPSLSSQLFILLSRLILFPKGNEKLLEFSRSETAGSYSWPHPHVGLLLSCLRNILKWWPFWRGQGQSLGGWVALCWLRPHPVPDGMWGLFPNFHGAAGWRTSLTAKLKSPPSINMWIGRRGWGQQLSGRDGQGLLFRFEDRM